MNSTTHAFLLATAAFTAMTFSGIAQAGGRDSLNNFTRGLQNADAQFSQTVFDNNGQQREQSQGKLSLASPRQFRWEYTRPYPQLIVADGQTVWVYEPDLQQVTRRAQGAAEANSPLAALINPARLERDYNSRDLTDRGNGLQWLELTPKGSAEDAGFQQARLGFDARQQLTHMVIIDALGQRTEIRFEQWRRNQRLAADTFRFQPPAGVDVIGE